MGFDILNNLHIYMLQAEAHHETGYTMERLLESNVFNVILALIIIGFVVSKMKVGDSINNKRQALADDITAVELQKKEALDQLEDVKKRTANLKSEVEEILTQARQSAESLSTQILSDARTESGKIVENAKRRMELEQRAAMKDLEARLLNDSLSNARHELAQSLTPADQRRSVEAFLEELPALKEAR